MHHFGHTDVFQSESYLRLALARDDTGCVQSRLWHEPGLASVRHLPTHDTPRLLEQQDLPVGAYHHRRRPFMRTNAQSLPPRSLVVLRYTQPLEHSLAGDQV